MEEWWNALATELKIFYVIGITSSLVLVVQLILILFGMEGGDSDVGDAVDVDADATGEHPGDLHVLSVRTIVAFFMGFGWTGVICLKQGNTIVSTLEISLLVGAVFMGLVFYLMKMLYGLRDSGNIHYRNAIGKIGSVYIPIPPDQSGPGQIEIMIQGRVRFVQAFTKSDRKLTNKCRVKVVDMLDQGTLLVEPVAIPESDTKEK